MPKKQLKMVWYKCEHYEQIKSRCEDGDKLHKTYGEWLKSAELGYKSLESKGEIVMRVNIEPDKFFAWCKDNSLIPNASARNKFVISH